MPFPEFKIPGGQGKYYCGNCDRYVDFLTNELGPLLCSECAGKRVDFINEQRMLKRIEQQKANARRQEHKDQVRRGGLRWLLGKD